MRVEVEGRLGKRGQSTQLLLEDMLDILAPNGPFQGQTNGPFQDHPILMKR